MAEQTTQDFLEINDIKEGVLILKNNDIRGVLMISSTNFALQSNEDQSAVIYAFQSFLNSLDFPCQILVQSRKINITPYLDNLKKLETEQTNELLKIQTSSYIEFIKNFTESVSIMTKSFFVVIPYTHTSLKQETGFFGKLFSKKSKKEELLKDQLDFEEKRSQLEERVSVIQQGLSRCGIKSAQLGTEEVIEVFYKVFNPGELESKIELEQ